MINISSKRYYRVISEYVDAGELEQDIEFNSQTFKKGDFVIMFRDGSQMPMKRDIFLKRFRSAEEYVDFKDLNDTIEADKRIIKKQFSI